MKNHNKYGNLSGGYIFDFLDKKAHKYAISHIGECVTGTANIKYINPLLRLSDKTLERSYEKIGENKIKVFTQLWSEFNSGERIYFVKAEFLFIKI